MRSPTLLVEHELRPCNPQQWCSLPVPTAYTSPHIAIGTSHHNVAYTCAFQHLLCLHVSVGTCCSPLRGRAPCLLCHCGAACSGPWCALLYNMCTHAILQILEHQPIAGATEHVTGAGVIACTRWPTPVSHQCASAPGATPHQCHTSWCKETPDICWWLTLHALFHKFPINGLEFGRNTTIPQFLGHRSKIFFLQVLVTLLADLRFSVRTGEAWGSCELTLETSQSNASLLSPNP